MKKMNRLISLVLVLVMTIALFPGVVLEAEAASFDPVWPCESAYNVTCLYYYKDGTRHSCKYDNTKGIDIAGGGNIVAVEDGTVVTATYDTTSGFGNYVIIEHDNGSRSVYAHLASYCVAPPSRVSKGQVIGVMGNTSAKYNIGTHLHFEYQGADPWKTYYKSKYAQNITYDSNVRSNNASYNSDKTIVEWIDQYYAYSNGAYRYKGGAPSVDNPPAATHTKDVSFNSWLPIHSYARSTGKVTVYNVDGTAYDSSDRYISGSSDECIIQEIYTDGWCQVKYPSSREASGYFTAYVKLSEFISSVAPSNWTATASTDAYRRSTGSATIGSVSKNDKCLKVASADGRYQVIYPVTGKGYFRMGWVDPNAGGSSGSSGGGSNTGVATGYLLPCYAYTLSTGRVNVYNSSRTVYTNRWIDGANDRCIIREIYSDGWCYISYPSSAEADGYFEAYVPLSTFISNPSPVTWSAPNRGSAYRRSTGGDTIGEVYAGDACVKVDSANGRLQLMYPCDGGYHKLGWVDGAASYNPEGCYDDASGGLYSVYVRGWAFDRDDVNASLEIHVYVGGRHVKTLTANTGRPDVNDVFGTGAHHGFEATFEVPHDLTGNQEVRVYALNIHSGNNTDLGAKVVNIASDNTPPVISNVKIEKLDATGYTVTCTVTDANGVDRVQFPTWTVLNDQDDLFADWGVNQAASGTKNGNTYTYQAHTSAHNYEGGRYETHIYAYDKYGNHACYILNEVNVPIEVQSVSLSGHSLSFEGTGKSQTLSATVYPSSATDKTITWSSSDTAVATVSNGKVTAVGSGTALITASAGNGICDTCVVTVAEATITGISVAAMPAGTVYYVGDTLDPTGLKLTVAYSDGTTKTITGGYDYSPKTLNAVGTQTVTVTYQGKSTSFTVNVKAMPVGELNVGSADALPGETVQIPLVLTQNPGLIAARLKVSYDSDALTLTGVSEGEVQGEYTFGADLGVMPYIVLWENSDFFSDCTATGELVTLTFRISDDAAPRNFPITVSYDPEEVYNADFVNVDLTVNQGYVAVTARQDAASGTSGDLAWTLTGEGILTFSGEGEMKDYEHKSEMPWYAHREQIKTVVLEEGVTSVGDYAFYGMPNLECIEIASTVTSIGDYAFKNAPKIDNVVLPQGLTSLGDSAFYACTGLTAIEIPASLWTVKPYTFKNCTNLTAVVFHEGNLEKISDGAFYGTGLRSLVLPDCLDILDEYSFKGCSKLEYIELGTGLTELREAVFYGTAIPTIEIPEGITKIGPYAFKNCVALETIELPESLTSVGEASFYACSGLTEVRLPDVVKTIGNYAFRKCAAIEKLTFGENLETIGECAFYGCTSLTELVIPDKVTVIKPYAFKTCTGLTSVIFGESVKTIGEGAFNTCTGLKTIVFPASVKSIGDYCFSGSIDLWKLTFEADAPAIGTGAFKGLDAYAYYPGDNTTWNSSNMLNYGGSITWKAQ